MSRKILKRKVKKNKIKMKTDIDKWIGIKDLTELIKRRRNAARKRQLKRTQLKNVYKNMLLTKKKYKDQMLKDINNPHVFKTALHWYNTFTHGERIWFTSRTDLWVAVSAGDITPEYYVKLLAKFKRFKKDPRRLLTLSKETKRNNKKRKKYYKTMIKKATKGESTNGRFKDCMILPKPDTPEGEYHLKDKHEKFLKELWYTYISKKIAYNSKLVYKCIDIHMGSRTKPKGIIKGYNFKRFVNDDNYPLKK